MIERIRCGAIMAKDGEQVDMEEEARTLAVNCSDMFMNYS